MNLTVNVYQCGNYKGMVADSVSDVFLFLLKFMTPEDARNSSKALEIEAGKEFANIAVFLDGHGKKMSLGEYVSMFHSVK